MSSLHYPEYECGQCSIIFDNVFDFVEHMYDIHEECILQDDAEIYRIDAHPDPPDEVIRGIVTHMWENFPYTVGNVDGKPEEHDKEKPEKHGEEETEMNDKNDNTPEVYSVQEEGPLKSDEENKANRCVQSK